MTEPVLNVLGDGELLTVQQATREAWIAQYCTVGPAGYGQCWGCPVRQCVMWEDPEAVLSMATAEVIAKAVGRLWENRTVVVGKGGRSLVLKLAEGDGAEDHLQLDPLGEAQLALLSSVLLTNDYGRYIRAQMAAEAIIQNAPEVAAKLTKAEDQYLREWFKAFTRREPSQDEVFQRDDRLERLRINVAAEVYDTDEHLVKEALVQLRGYALRPTAAYRRSNGARRSSRTETDA